MKSLLRILLGCCGRVEDKSEQTTIKQAIYKRELYEVEISPNTNTRKVKTSSFVRKSVSSENASLETAPVERNATNGEYTMDLELNQKEDLKLYSQTPIKIKYTHKREEIVIFKDDLQYGKKLLNTPCLTDEDIKGVFM